MIVLFSIDEEEEWLSLSSISSFCLCTARFSLLGLLETLVSTTSFSFEKVNSLPSNDAFILFSVKFEDVGLSFTLYCS